MIIDIDRTKNIKSNKIGYSDWIIGIVLVASIVATIVIIVCQQ